ncbi:DUF6571 family protein [Streptomyces mexicanus]|uniref:DUF6571 domain-containing protein n=1 Tax=Streptomyces mexicanus TaxID=178566 RepID=A0A7X1I2N2_9ACTN|nr:DUF6571 family protein [Streptomyces mexicanus]MBC2867687.1 hypothetical protein [Streptomyces mexicanus]
MVSFDQLLNARLGSLKNAVDDWSETVKKLKSLQEKAENGMQRKAEKADWKGENAGITKPFVKKTAKEFGDAAKEAESIHSILRDALAEFTAAQKQLNDVVHDAPAKGIRVDSNGAVSYLVHPDHRGKGYKGPEPEEADFDKVRADIKAALDKANDADEIASRALRTLVGKDETNFSGTEYDSLKQAGRVQDAEDARAAAKIVAKGDSATVTEIDRLNKYLKENNGDRYFAERFALEVGAKGTLDYWADMGDPSDGSRLGADHPERIKELQKNWGLTLASATHSNSPEMAAWKTDMVKSGDDLVRTRGTSVYGFQIMSNLMRNGEYDTKFLQDYGHAAFAAERRLTHEGRLKPQQAWDSPLGMPPKLNWDGKDVGQDPMEGFMEALGHNPRASQEFFTSKLDLTPDNTHDHKDVDAFKYFTHDRDWPEENTGSGLTNKYGYESLGHALESATLGHAYDDPSPKLARNDDAAKVMEKVVAAYSDPELLKKQEVLSDSIGRMAAGYIDDINWALNENRSDSMFAPGAGAHGHAEFGMDGARKFLSALGQHPDAYSEVATAERVYTSSAMDGQVNSHGHINEPGVREALRTGAEVQGMLDQSRADQVEAEGLQKDKEYNEALQKRASWVQFGVGVGIATGAAFLPATAAVGVAGTLIPLATDQGKAFVQQVMGNFVGDWAESDQRDSADDIQKQRSQIFKTGEFNAGYPMTQFLAQHHINPDESNFAQDLETDMIAGYGKGTDRENQQGVRPQTGD